MSAPGCLRRSLRWRSSSVTATSIPEHMHPEDQLVYACQGVMTVRTSRRNVGRSGPASGLDTGSNSP